MSNLKNIFVKPAIFMTVLTIFFQLLILLIYLANYVPSPTFQFDINYDITSFFEELSPLSSIPESIDFASSLGENSSDSVLDLNPERNTNYQIVIKAVNPGYNTETGKNAGEFIEIANLSGEPQPLDDIAVVYTAKPTSSSPNGKSTILYYFPEGSMFIGDTILLRYKDTPETSDKNQDLIYNTSLAMAGTLSLVRLKSDVVINDPPTTLDDLGKIENSLCWLGGEECLPVFSTTVKSRSYTTILRNEETGEYEHVTDYTPTYDPNQHNLYLPPENKDISSNLAQSQTGKTTASAQSASSELFNTEKDAQCQGLIFSEILSYYDEKETEQFIELYNSTGTSMLLSGCKIKYKTKYYELPISDAIDSLDYYVLHPEFKLTKNPNTENTLELYDVNGALVDSLSYPHGQKKTASYAQVGYKEDGTEDWRITYAVTPGEPNVYQQYKSCTDGKVINESTGNCVKAATMSSSLADCPAGKYRNPTTGRCKNIDSDGETAECKEGYERNPETGRCRKIKNNEGADYPVVPVTGMEERSVFVGLLAILGVVVIGAICIIFQFRREIIYSFRKIISKLKK